MRPLAPSAALGEGESIVGWRGRAVLWSALLAAAAYLAVMFWSGWHDIWSSVARVGVGGLAAVLLLSLANYGLRFVRWQIYLRAMGHHLPWAPSLAIYLAGFALTTTPAKAGEALRGVLLQRRGVPYAVSFAAFFSERLSDLMAIVALTLVGMTGIYPAALPLVAVSAVGVIALYAVAASRRVLEWLRASARGSARSTALRRGLADVLLNANHCHSPRLLCVASALSLVAWLAEAWAFYLLLHWSGNDVALPFAVFCYAFSMLAGALSFMPGGLGGAEAAMIAVLMVSGVSQGDAIAATLLCRLTTLWFAVAIGMAAMARLSVRTPRPPADHAGSSE